jgi:hypothetical protein
MLRMGSTVDGKNERRFILRCGFAAQSAMHFEPIEVISSCINKQWQSNLQDSK